MKKALILILAVIIVAGLIVIFTAGFNYDILTKQHQQIQVSIGEQYKNDELKKLVEDVIGQGVEVQKMGDFEDQAVISAKEIPADKVGEIVSKINEKYGKELTADNIEVKDIPGTRLVDLLNPYVGTLILSTILVLVYIALKYKKIGCIKSLLIVIVTIAVSELAVFSVLAITRIPVGRSLPSIMFVLYALSTIGATIYLENKYQESKQESKLEEKKQ